MKDGLQQLHEANAPAQKDSHVYWFEWSVALLLVGCVCWFGLAHLTRLTHAQLINRLQTTLDICTRGLEQWMNERQMDAQIWAQETKVTASIQRVLKLHSSRSAEHAEELRAEIEQLRSYLRPVCKAYQYTDFVVIDRQGHRIASLLEDSLNLRLPNDCMPFVQRAFQGETIISVPFRANCLLPNLEGEMRTNLPTMFVLTPVLDDQNEVAAVLGLRIRPEEAFSRNLMMVRPGLSGETYAFNGQGFMVSQSRFDEHLRQIGLLSDDSDSHAILNVKLCNPGVNLLTEARPRTPLEERPLTRMAQDALQGHEGSDVEGYRDYRGVPVVGAWRWLPKYGIGLTHEIDVAEVYAPIHSTKNVFLMVLGLMSTTTLASVLTRARKRSTERDHRNIATELAESHQCSQSIVDAALDAVITVDDQGIVTQWNGQAEATFGWKSHEVLGRLLSERIIPDRYRKVHDAGLALLRKTSRSIVLEQRIETKGLHRDGHEFPIELSVTHLPIGKETFYCAFIRDLTQSKHAEEQERRHLSELAHVHRMNTAGQLVSELAHELNQPLSAATNYARACVRFLQNGTGATKEELREWMQQAAAQTSLAIEIVGKLRELVRKDTSPRTQLDLSRVVRDVIPLFAPDLRSRQISLSLDLCPTLPLVSGDRVQIKQVLVNLIYNAIDALSEQSAQARRLTVRTRNLQEKVEVEVRDSGCGIDHDIASQLFEPFQSTKPQGMGLGLSISRTIIEAHDGRIWGEFDSNVSTTFRFTLPVVEVSV